jgi:hypothetical protein
MGTWGGAAQATHFIAAAGLTGSRPGRSHRPRRRSTLPVICWGTVMGDATGNRPMCPVCKHRMSLARISPGTRGFQERTFECSTCGPTEKTSVTVDPVRQTP